MHDNVKEWIRNAKPYFEIHLISNNPSKKRIKCISKQLGLTYTYRANKPSRKKLEEYIISSNAKPYEVAIIGDRIFTDVLAGNRLGVYTILVKPIKSNGKQNDANNLQMIESKIAGILGVLQK